MTNQTGDRKIPDPDLEPTISIPRAGAILGICRTSAYKAAKEGRLPLLAPTPGRRLVNTARFLELYGLGRWAD